MRGTLSISMTNHETIKPIGTYSEDIDWDVIYHTFHNPKDIAERIAFELTNHEAPVIFCGFPEAAAYLATATELEFVDSSPVIIKRTKQRYPDIKRITKGNISDILKESSTKNVVISCRLSAFWQTEQAFKELTSTILAHPRDQILIDFFDREAVFEGMHIYYQEDETKRNTGDWDFKHFDQISSKNPEFQIANVDISYKITATDKGNDIDFAYETRRTFFTKMAILNWCTKVFPDYETTLATALLEGDPSFLVKLKRI